MSQTLGGMSGLSTGGAHRQLQTVRDSRRARVKVAHSGTACPRNCATSTAPVSTPSWLKHTKTTGPGESAGTLNTTGRGV